MLAGLASLVLAGDGPFASLLTSSSDWLCLPWYRASTSKKPIAVAESWATAGATRPTSTPVRWTFERDLLGKGESRGVELLVSDKVSTEDV